MKIIKVFWSQIIIHRLNNIVYWFYCYRIINESIGLNNETLSYFVLTFVQFLIN